MKLIFLSLMSVAVFAQTVNLRAITVNSDAQVAFNAYAITQADPTVSTALSLAVDASTTAIRVDAGAGLTINSVIKIDNEAMLITARSGRDITVTRGALGTTAATHDTSAPVALLKYASLQEYARTVAIDAIRALVARYDPAVNAAASAVEATRKTKTDAAAQ